MSNLREPVAPAVIAGSFADYRLIKSRGCLQIIIEIPVEAQAVAFDVLGYPMPGIEIPVAVARLNPLSADDETRTPPTDMSMEAVRGRLATLTPLGSKAKGVVGPAIAEDEPFERDGALPSALTPKARYAAMTAGEQAVQRAAMLPKDERFRAWVNQEIYGPAMAGAVSNESAAEYIRWRCCSGASRKLIAEDPEAMDRFVALETAFKIAVGEIAEPR